jgi:hypothetical protein
MAGPGHSGTPRAKTSWPRWGPALQPPHQRLHLRQRHQAVTQLTGLSLGLLLRLFRPWQHEVGAEKQDPGGHDDPVRLLAERHFCWRQRQRVGQLFDDRLQGQRGQVDLLRARQTQQKIQRACKAVEAQVRRGRRPNLAPGFRLA